MEKIMVIGSSNTDLLIKTNRIPDPGETVLGGTFMMNAGGKGANQAVAVARIGGGVKFVAKIGDDMFGQRSLESYARDGIDISYIIKDGAAPSGMALITVDAAGENCIVVAPGANDRLTPADIDAVADAIRRSEYLLMQLEIPMPAVEYAAAIAREAGTKVILNPAPAAVLSDGLLSGLYMITPNRSESQLLTGVVVDGWEGAERAADVLLARGVRNVVVTLGSLGRSSAPARCRSVFRRTGSTPWTLPRPATFSTVRCAWGWPRGGRWSKPSVSPRVPRRSP